MSRPSADHVAQVDDEGILHLGANGGFQVGLSQHTGTPKIMVFLSSPFQLTPQRIPKQKRHTQAYRLAKLSEATGARF